MPALKKTQINASLFPDVAAGPATASSSRHTTAVNSPAGSVYATEDVVDGDNDFLGLSTSDGNEKIVLVQFEENDPENPLLWTRAQKWSAVVLLNAMTMCIGLSTSAYSSGIGKMSAELGVSEVAGQVGMFTFNAACAVMPLFVAPLTELAGRRYIFVGGFGAFVAVSFMLAFGQNLATQIVGRLLQGAFGSIGTILVGGVMSDCFGEADRALPMSIFSFSAIFSTIAAPVYSGYIDQYLGWRWIQYIHIIFSGIVFLFEAAFLRESRAEAILRTRAARLRKETGDARFRAQIELEGESISALFRQQSLRALKLLVTEPVVSLYGLYIALAWGTVFLFLSVIPLTFQGNHGWSEGNAGLPYLALILGCFAGFATGLWQDHLYIRDTTARGGVARPEARLFGAMYFGPLFGIGIMIYSWTQFGFVHWIAPCIALFLIIVGIYHVFLSVYQYTSDSYPSVASSAIAAQGLMRNGFAASFPLFGRQMFQGMGLQWAGLLLACLALAIAPLPFVLFAKGESIRRRSRYAAASTGAKGKGDEESEEKGSR